MENLVHLINRIFSIKKNNEANKKVIRYLVFVAFATVFWFLNALSKDYTTVVSYPVNYIGLPEDKALVHELPKELSMEVKGYGFALLRYKISTAFLPITFNISSFTDEQLEKNNILNYTIVTNNIKSRIAKKLSKDIQILSIYPDTIGLHFSKIIDKKIAIKPIVNATFEKQYGISGKVTANPDSVLISAPSFVIDTIKFVETEVLNFKDLNKSIKRNVLLKKQEGIKYEFKRTVVNVPIDQFIESSKLIKISIKNLPDRYKLRLFPDRVKINFRVALTKYKNINDNDFILSVDYNELTSLSNVLKINLDKYPEAISNISISKAQVESIIEKTN